MAPLTFGGRWQVVGSLGEGGQGHIFKVRDVSSKDDRIHALKRLKKHDRLSRFKQEIAAAQLLNHPGIARLIDHSLDEPAYFVSEYVSDRTLEDMGKTKPLEALRVLGELCDAVAHAHDKGVVHRDLKPANVMLRDNNTPVIIDFGLCYFHDQEERLTTTMEQVGSRFYMAPELEGGRSEVVTSAVDVYALGKILYFMLSGRHLAREAFRGDGDLSRVCSDLQLGYVTDNILATSVIVEPERRVKVGQLASAALEVHRLIEEHYYPGIVNTRCRFCGQGNYHQAEEIASVETRTPGLTKHNNLFMVVCDKCRNVQWFTHLPRERQ